MWDFLAFTCINGLSFESQMCMDSNSPELEAGICFCFFKIGIMFLALQILSICYIPTPSLSQQCHCTLKLRRKLLCLNLLLTLGKGFASVVYFLCCLQHLPLGFFFFAFRCVEMFFYLLRKMSFIYLVFLFLSSPALYMAS